MSFVSLSLPPGIYKNGTAYQAKGRYNDANLVRFYEGSIRPIGGWRVKSNSALTGSARSILTWRANDGTPYVAIGTHSKLYAMDQGGGLTNITPFRETGTLGSGPFATTSGSHTVTVTDSSHGLTVGDTVLYSGASTVATLDMNGEWVVVTTPTSSTYTFTHTGTANATTTGGGASVSYSYEISPGLEDAVSSVGYGGGAYGDGTYGTSRPDVYPMSDVRVWQLDTFGENLLAAPGNDGGIYEWALDISSRAAIVSGAPTARGLVVTEERIVMALGADGNPRNEAWSDQEDDTDWTPAATNQAGDFNLQTPGRTVCARRVRGAALTFTNVDVWRNTYTADNSVYSIERIGDGCGIMSAGAVATSDTIAVWMGINKNFWLYNGGYVQSLPCDVSDYVFSDFNAIQASKVTCHYLSEFGEFWWFYPSSDSNENDRYITWSPNAAPGTQWNIGELARLCGCDRGTFFFPLRIGSDGYVYEHEVGLLDLDSVTPYVKSGPIELGNGDRVSDILSYIPDEKTAGDVTLTIAGKFYPNDTETSYGPYTAANPTDLRITARQITVEYIGVTASDWRIGAPRLDIRPGSMR